jgi:hypothetical protein
MKHYKKMKEMSEESIEPQYYIMSGPHPVDGPFDSPEEAKEYLALMCNEYASPELLAQFLCVVIKGRADLYKENGQVVSGNYLLENHPDNKAKIKQ